LNSKELEYIDILQNSSFKMNEFVEDFLIHFKANYQELKEVSLVSKS